MSTYRITLYKQIEERWQYVRLSATPEGALRTEEGICGYTSGKAHISLIPAGTDAETALRKAGEMWLLDGYQRMPQGLQMMTLHFRMPKWRGLPAGAPWFEEWCQFYLDPVRTALQVTGNGIPQGEERFSGNYLFFFAVPNPDMARQNVALVAAASPVQFDFEIYIGEENKQVEIPISPDVPDFLQEFLRGFEASARTIARGLAKVSVDALQPELVIDHAQRRVKGEEATVLKQRLRERWNFECQFWDPVSHAAPGEVVYLQQPEALEYKQQIAAALRQEGQQQFYLLDCENGLFRIEPEEIFDWTHEGMIFSAALDWVIYCSFYQTVTFGGEHLVSQVRKIFSTRPEVLNVAG